jgi:hypothetical protein
MYLKIDKGGGWSGLYMIIRYFNSTRTNSNTQTHQLNQH